MENKSRISDCAYWWVVGDLIFYNYGMSVGVNAFDKQDFLS